MIWLLFIFQVIFIIFTVFAAEDNILSKSAYLIILENKHLAGHIVKQFQSQSLMSCSQSCLRYSWCTSTNFKVTVKKDDEGTCELNKHEVAPAYENIKLIDRPGATFSIFLKGCLMTGCLNGGSCLFDMRKETFTCSCKLLWSGESCEVRMANNYALNFTRKGTSDYVITSGMQSLRALTVCLWMKTADQGNSGTPLSYNLPGLDNEELVLFDYKYFEFHIGGSSRATSVSANDGIWHHICATWENTAGSWKLYKDGKVEATGTDLSKNHVLRSGGMLVLGQEQDSLGGSFDASQCFIGEMTGVNIWDHVVDEQEIMRMSKSCPSGVGNVFQWSDVMPHVKGSVKIIKPSC